MKWASILSLKILPNVLPLNEKWRVKSGPQWNALSRPLISVSYIIYISWGMLCAPRLWWGAAYALKYRLLHSISAYMSQYWKASCCEILAVCEGDLNIAFVFSKFTWNCVLKVFALSRNYSAKLQWHVGNALRFVFFRQCKINKRNLPVINFLSISQRNLSCLSSPNNYFASNSSTSLFENLIISIIYIIYRNVT